MASHQAELSREGNFTEKKYLSISSLQTDDINPDGSSGCGRNSKIENNVQTKCTFCGDSNNYAEFFSKVSVRKRKKLVRPVICTTDTKKMYASEMF